MQSLETRQNRAASFVFWGAIEFAAVAAIFSKAAELISTPSDTSLAIGVVMVAALVAALVWQFIGFSKRPVEKTAQTPVNKAAASAAAVRKGPGEIVKGHGVEVFVPEGEEPIKDETNQ